MCRCTRTLLKSAHKLRREADTRPGVLQVTAAMLACVPDLLVWQARTWVGCRATKTLPNQRSVTSSTQIRWTFVETAPLNCTTFCTKLKLTFYTDPHQMFVWIGWPIIQAHTSNIVAINFVPYLDLPAVKLVHHAIDLIGCPSSCG